MGKKIILTLVLGLFALCLLDCTYQKIITPEQLKQSKYHYSIKTIIMNDGFVYQFKDSDGKRVGDEIKGTLYDGSKVSIKLENVKKVYVR